MTIESRRDEIIIKIRNAPIQLNPGGVKQVYIEMIIRDINNCLLTNPSITLKGIPNMVMATIQLPYGRMSASHYRQFQ
jgi:hypothetical protein